MNTFICQRDSQFKRIILKDTGENYATDQCEIKTSKSAVIKSTIYTSGQLLSIIITSVANINSILSSNASTSH